MHPLGHMTVAGGTVWFGARLFGQTSASARALADRIDYRLVFLGGLIPDLIDKPIGWIILRDHFDANGHLYGHTLLAALIVLIPGLLLAIRLRDPRVLALGLAMLCHLAVDPVNHSPESLLWPLLGTEFPEISLLGTRMTILTETISGLMLLTFLFYLHRSDRLSSFIRNGRLT